MPSVKRKKSKPDGVTSLDDEAKLKTTHAVPHGHQKSSLSPLNRSYVTRRSIQAALIMAIVAFTARMLFNSRMRAEDSTAVRMLEIREMALGLIETFQAQSPVQMVMNWSHLSGSPPSPPSPGALARVRGVESHHPVVLVPGFVTSGLEVWRGKECSKKAVYFRGRLWGKLEMVQAFLRDPECWFKHMSLDPTTETGDPEGITVRAAHGLHSLDYFMEGFWVFSKLIEALGEIGYLPETTLVAAPYDWRLSIPMLEVRDQYFTRLKHTVEGLVALNDGRKVVLISHSFGENVVRSFITWLGGPWCDKHLEALVNLAGPTLGMPKAISALLSGEMKDTTTLGLLAAYLANALIPIDARAVLFRSWGSLLEMMPVGGSKVWKDPMLVFNTSGAGIEHMDASEAIRMMLNESRLEGGYEKGGPKGKSSSRQKGLPFFPDASLVPLPSSPSVKIYCIYGVGLPTETGYAYKRNPEASNSSTDWRIDASFNDATSGHENGVVSSDGDLTVPLVSLGAMCVKGWRGRRLNPSSMRVVVREKNHSVPIQITLDPRGRGGVQSGHHVDVLGNDGLLNDVIEIVSGHGSTLEDEIVSDIRRVVEAINF